MSLCIKDKNGEIIKVASSGGGASTAEQITYDNTKSEVEATNIQDAIDGIFENIAGGDLVHTDRKIADINLENDIEAIDLSEKIIPTFETREELESYEAEYGEFPVGTKIVITSEQGEGGASSADKVSYDNSESGLAAVDVQSAVDELTEKKIDKDEVLPTYTLAEYEEIKDNIPVGTKFAISDDEGGDTPTPSGGGLFEWFVVDDNHAISYDSNVQGACVCNASGYNGSYAFMFGMWRSRTDGFMKFYGTRDTTNQGELVVKNGKNIDYYNMQVYIIAGFLKSDVEKYNIQQITL